MAIATLLGITVAVLGACGAFVIRLARRAARANDPEAAELVTPPSRC